MVLCLRNNVSEVGSRADHPDWHPGHVDSTSCGHCARTENTLGNAGNLVLHLLALGPGAT